MVFKFVHFPFCVGNSLLVELTLIYYEALSAHVWKLLWILYVLYLVYMPYSSTCRTHSCIRSVTWCSIMFSQFMCKASIIVDFPYSYTHSNTFHALLHFCSNYWRVYHEHVYVWSRPYTKEIIQGRKRINTTLNMIFSVTNYNCLVWY